ncbi:hypothetical protein N7537_001338 [Penicillium hordei]|uniref:Uncharacterized protein n=1 Tax=Penicillium hordei TaxID=40994 RepID=A0AAD6EGG4_9EURO|nr:uncharacterized protein N7537_001338 [Penicillium hordei]KAJ5616224.1 hypothetical protein N7537_001338 [Penicillium hordei]
MLRTYPSPISGDPLGAPMGHREPTSKICQQITYKLTEQEHDPP